MRRGGWDRSGRGGWGVWVGLTCDASYCVCSLARNATQRWTTRGLAGVGCVVGGGLLAATTLPSFRNAACRGTLASRTASAGIASMTKSRNGARSPLTNGHGVGASKRRKDGLRWVWSQWIWSQVCSLNLAIIPARLWFRIVPQYPNAMLSHSNLLSSSGALVVQQSCAVQRGDVQ